jgi:hypothetical protein
MVTTVHGGWRGGEEEVGRGGDKAADHSAVQCWPLLGVCKEKPHHTAKSRREKRHTRTPRQPLECNTFFVFDPSLLIDSILIFIAVGKEVGVVAVVATNNVPAAVSSSESTT